MTPSNGSPTLTLTGQMVAVCLIAVAIPTAFVLLAFSHGSSLWQLLSIVFASGAAGGVINALMSDQGFALPGRNAAGSGDKASVVIRPGFLGNVLIGAAAAAVSWGLYGTFASTAIISRSTPAKGTTAIIATIPRVTAGNSQPTQQTFDLPLSALVSAFLIGIGGTRWLSAEVDKTLLAAAASKAASSEPSHDASTRMQASSPSGVLAIANELKPAAPTS